MSLLSKLFGMSDKPASSAAAVEYSGCTILASPIKEGSKFRISAQIEKDVAGQVKTHTLVRADVLDSYEDAVEASIRKAKLMIDEQGERLFG